MNIVYNIPRKTTMNQEPLMMTFDFGTQSVRTCIFDKKGECLALSKKKYDPAYYSSKPGYAEMDANYYYDCLCETTKAIVAEHPDLVKRCAGISLSCFRDTAVLLDKDNKLVRPTILWLDQRMAKCEDKLPLLSRVAFSLVGMTEVINVNRRRTPLNWVKENEPDNFNKVSKYIAISTYFIFRLTGNMKDSASSYTGHYPMDYKKRQWYKKPEKHLKGMIFSQRKDQLADLVGGGELCGCITKEAAKDTGLPEGMKLFAGGSDKSCETLGAGVINSSKLAISLGTACTIETTTQKYVEPVTFLPAYPNVLPDLYNMDFQIYRGFWMVNWFLKEFGGRQIADMMSEGPTPVDFDDHLDQIDPGCNGLLIQPYWGPLLDRPAVKGAMVGFSDSTTIYHIYKSLIEGICFELRAAKEMFEKKLHDTPFKEIRVSGGGARRDEICQIIADVFNLPVYKLQTVEASSLGAAISGFVAVKSFENPEQAVANMVHPGKEFKPNPNNVKIYDEIFKNGYAKLYGSLKKVYKFIYEYQLRKMA